MDINKTKFVVDVLMFLDFLIVAISGFVLLIVFPAGEQSGRAPAFLLDRFGWLDLHNWGSIILIILILIHLILNFNWIKCMILNFFKGKDGK